jgi:hypothetical protein
MGQGCGDVAEAVSCSQKKPDAGVRGAGVIARDSMYE